MTWNITLQEYKEKHHICFECKVDMFEQSGNKSINAFYPNGFNYPSYPYCLPCADKLELIPLTDKMHRSKRAIDQTSPYDDDFYIKGWDRENLDW